MLNITRNKGGFVSEIADCINPSRYERPEMWLLLSTSNERETDEARRLKSRKSREVNSAISPRRRRRRHPTAITPLCEFARFAYFRKRCTQESINNSVRNESAARLPRQMSYTHGRFTKRKRKKGRERGERERKCTFPFSFLPLFFALSSFMSVRFEFKRTLP